MENIAIATSSICTVGWMRWNERNSNMIDIECGCYQQYNLVVEYANKICVYIFILCCWLLNDYSLVVVG